ncbi:MAG: hypothetical protein K0S09_1880 [Sphingobacteriaceae bacterium]|jgi:hypothetical protein|nr:hypothetical protein [Sphingobacteriaceae bacterium]
MEPNPNTTARKKDSNKIYFLIVVILALLGTNAYLFFKDKSANERIVSLSDSMVDQKSSMETEIDKIEAELDKSNASNIQLTAAMKSDQELARKKIEELRVQLKAGKLTQGQLARAQEDIKQLRYFVTKYTDDIEVLQKKNASLTLERDSLKSTVSDVTAKASQLESQNTELNSKVKIASALKVGTIGITPLRVRNSGKETDVTRASTAEKLRISFNIADNPVAQKGMHDIYVRVIDPSGNLVTSDNNAMFNADGEDLQYSYKTSIDFSNDSKVYNIEWANPNKFQKGTYTVVLYADGYTMGKTSIGLR